MQHGDPGSDTTKVKRAWWLTAAAVLTLGVPATSSTAAAEYPMCVSVRHEVVAWSRQHARAPGRAHVVGIRGARLVSNRVSRSPANGVLLSCRGRATLSNGLRQPVRFGIRAIDGSWYLFLKRVPKRS